MVRLLFFYFYCLMPGIILSQSYTKRSLVEVGDVLYTATDNSPRINLKKNKDNHWDFRRLQSGQEEMTVFLPASEGMAGGMFPSADMYYIKNGTEYYLETKRDEIREIGIIGEMDGFSIIAPYSPYGIYQKSKLKLNSSYSEEYEISFISTADQFALLDDLDLPIMPDSVRMIKKIKSRTVVDDQGEVLFPRNAYEVIRLKKIKTTEIKIEILLPDVFSKWIDITEKIPSKKTGNKKEIIYEFIASNEKEPIVHILMDKKGERPVSATFKIEPSENATNSAHKDKTLFVGLPNPAYGDVRVDVRGFPQDNYSIDLYNLTGKLIQSNPYEIQRDTTVTFNVSSLPRGTYFYALVNGKGETLRTKRIMVIKP